MSEHDPVTVFVAQGEAEAHQVRGFLEANGIPVVIRGESVRFTHGLTMDGLGRVELQVAPADVERARDLLARVEAGELALAEDEPVTPPEASEPGP